MNTSSQRMLGIAGAFAILCLLAAPKLMPLFKQEPADLSPQTKPALRVSIIQVEPKKMTEVLSTTGTVRANEEVEIVSEISGKIRSIFFVEGSRVARGDLLLKIDDQELAAERQRAVHRLELAERAEIRQRRLLDQGVISPEVHDVALGELNVMRSELNLIDAQIHKTEIRAPFGGVIGLRWVSLGSYLSPQTRIVSLRDVDQVKIDFTVPERYAGLMAVGGEILFNVHGSDRTFKGEIFAIEPSVDENTRSVLLRAQSQNRGGVLVPGAFADVKLVVRQVDDALSVPSIAVIPELGGKKVFVYSDGIAEARSVETGMRTDARVEITNGLGVGELVIISGIQQLRSGVEVVADEIPTEGDVTS